MRIPLWLTQSIFLPLIPRLALIYQLLKFLLFMHPSMLPIYLFSCVLRSVGGLFHKGLLVCTGKFVARVMFYCGAFLLSSCCPPILMAETLFRAILEFRSSGQHCVVFGRLVMAEKSAARIGHELGTSVSSRQYANHTTTADSPYLINFALNASF